MGTVKFILLLLTQILGCVARRFDCKENLYDIYHITFACDQLFPPILFSVAIRSCFCIIFCINPSMLLNRNDWFCGCFFASFEVTYFEKFKQKFSLLFLQVFHFVSDFKFLLEMQTIDICLTFKKGTHCACWMKNLPYWHYLSSIF